MFDKEKASESLDYALKAISKGYRDLKISKLARKRILSEYKRLWMIFNNSFTYYDFHNLDSFQEAACLMTAITKVHFTFCGNGQVSQAFIKRLNGDDEDYKFGPILKPEFCLYAGLKMCKEPIHYVGENYDPEQLEKFKYQEFALEYPKEWKDISDEIIVANYYCNGSINETLHKYLALKYLYNYVNGKVDNISVENIENGFVKKLGRLNNN